MKIAVILGTRPEIIKMSPVISILDAEKSEYFILHTGQHHSYNMDRTFFEQLKLPQPKYNLNVGSGTHAEETARILTGTERIIIEESPDVVLVEGDTNSVLAGALASSKLLTRVGHVEAGLRSYDRTMPEEINRVLTDHLSDYLFAPTELAKTNLLEEGIGQEKIFVTGNTIVDAVHRNLEHSKDKDIAARLEIEKDGFLLVTLHRQENVDNVERFTSIMEGLKLLVAEFEKEIIYPIHPRARKRLRQFDIHMDEPKIKLVEPLDYLSFLKLECLASLILTDSGGVQEEACILEVPCVTLRYNTERPETIEVGANMIAGTEPKSILEKSRTMIGKQRNWRNPLGDGKAAYRIVELIRRLD